jgi:hypothetical protein
MFLYDSMRTLIMPRSTRKPKNLLLGSDAIARAERYSQLHGTSVSRLVDNLLRSLPLGEATPPRSLAVQRMRGVAQGSARDRSSYQKHLLRKYGK